MVYYEKSNIKTYKRQTKKEEKTFNQINLGYESQFEKGESVVILKEKDFNDLEGKLKTIEDIERELENKQNELEELDNKRESLELEIKTLNEDIKKELDLRSKLIFSYERVISDIQDKWIYKLLNMSLPKSYQLLEEFKDDK